jgi:FMN-dependent NADH-azoreductase
MKILHIDSSVLGNHSVTRELGADLVRALQRRHAGSTVDYRDLAAAPLQHLSAETFAARMNPQAELSAEQRRDVEAGNQALDNFLAADTIVIGAPMYNFSIPSQLKAWIDRIVVAGKTFSYSAAGPEGLAKGKKTFVISARGGFYGADSAAAGLDFQEAYLRGVLGFIGVTDIEFIRAEGLNMGPEQRAQSLLAAHREIQPELPIAA